MFLNDANPEVSCTPRSESRSALPVNQMDNPPSFPLMVSPGVGPFDLSPTKDNLVCKTRGRVVNKLGLSPTMMFEGDQLARRDRVAGNLKG